MSTKIKSPTTTYQIVKELGQGSSGRALLANMISSQIGNVNRFQVVIKEIILSKLSRVDQLQAKQEAKLLNRISHEYIVQFVESWEQGGILYIVTKYSDKSQQNIVLGDFGICKRFSTKKRNEEQFTDTVIGTPFYMPPEIIEGERYSYSADVWSLGCVIFELTTLKHPFRGQTLDSLFQNIKQAKVDINLIPASFPKSLKSLISRSIVKSTSQRMELYDIFTIPEIQYQMILFNLRSPRIRKSFS
ncbi:hypothetical protein HK098_006793 [Nowakowskiella sp. JEL0407]|nr:hypothetical protein HK098_006793 [Nowakowskiella sp. JEL0407]